MAKIKDYNECKAKKWFVLLKTLELFIVFLFTFGVYGLGLVATNSLSNCWEKWFWTMKSTTIMGIWFNGLGIIFVSLVYLICVAAILALIYYLIKGFITINWKWARLIAETPEGKKKRLEEIRKEELDDDEKCRKENGGFIAGDEVEVKKCIVGRVYGKKPGYPGVRFTKTMAKHIGEVYDVYEIDDDNDIILEYDLDDEDEYCWHSSMLKMKKKLERK